MAALLAARMTVAIQVVRPTAIAVLARSATRSAVAEWSGGGVAGRGAGCSSAGSSAAQAHLTALVGGVRLFMPLI